MNQQSVKYNNDMTRMESLLYDEDYKAWLEDFDVLSNIKEEYSFLYRE